MLIHTYAHTYTHAYTHTYARTYIYSYIYSYIHMYIHKYVDVNESDLKSLHQIQGNSNAKDFCAAGWFAHMLPRIQKENPKIYNSRIQFVQQAGETVFVPQGK